MSRKDTWEWKIANNKKGRWNIDKVSTPFFLTNFPSDMDNKQLWSICEKYGRVSDVYIARKLSKSGKRIAFVRFLKVQDEKQLELKLRDLWIGSFHVFVSLAKFGRENNRVHGESHVHVHTVGAGSNNTQKVTYANVVKGDVVKPNKAEKSIILEGKDIINELAVKPSVFCQVRSVRLIPKLLVLLKEEGFHDLQIKYLGGDWVYVEFDSDLVCSKFKKSSSIHAFFSNFRPVVNGFTIVERVVWIEILGLLCCAWNDNAVNKVAGIWGEVCFLDDDNQAPLAIKRVCIETAQSSLIQEKLSLEAQGINYTVVVKELSNWEPDILCNEDALNYDIPSLASDSEKEVNDFDEDVAEEEGEMTPKGFVDRKGRFFQTEPLKSDEHKRSYNSVPLDAPVGGPIDVSGDQRGAVGSGTAPDTPNATMAGSTVEAKQGLCEDNGSNESLSQPPGFRRDVELNPGTIKMKSNSASSHGSSRLLKKRVPDNIKDISDIMNQYVEMGRSAEERFGSVFCSSSAEDFNNFIDDVGGVDVPMIGKKFTRVDSSNVKLSKLDRFLVSEGVSDRFQGLQVAVLDRLWSDHSPILLHEVKVAYGPPPFRFFNSWMLLDGFDEMIRASVSEFEVNQSWSKFVVFKNKLKFIKNRIWEWIAQTKEIREQQKNDLKSRLHDIDMRIDSGDISTQICNERK
ncbi:unnamed protein product [Lactuca virosa]|uniref:RRM domain-containing protein n=1 Tax=Lactuca virosa TaxID=75947 RepID=A0AAU9P884_9ASTR|nr:unnamed protein product [Lactuca virosa]